MRPLRGGCRDLYRQVDTEAARSRPTSSSGRHAWLPEVDVKEMTESRFDNSGTVGPDEFVEMMMSHDALDQLAEINKLHTGAES